MWRKCFYLTSAIVFAVIVLLGLFDARLLLLLLIAVPLFALGVYDILQTERNILRNYPLVGHFRYLLLMIRPEIQQYFIEDNQNGKPFSKEQREMIYQRAHKSLDTLPFGTQYDVYAEGYESINHSLAPTEVAENEQRILVGGDDCKQPYCASRLNISAMSFGALSKNAIRALNRGARIGGFAHNTGEGSLSEYHLQEGGDIIWQIGTGYFGCRTPDGHFDAKQFADKAKHEQVKMIEIKLSQGAKPAHGGILPGIKVSAEIASIRGLEPGKDAISPPAHTTFSNPTGLLEYVAELRELSGGKPVGFKLCVGAKHEFMAICKAMVATNILPDFITVDGAEGGTGAAPVEFTDFIGVPLNDGLVFVNNCLVGVGVRDKIRVIASGKVVTGFDMATKCALGADMCNSARGMMFSLGCVQSRRCNTDTCPTGIATQNPKLMYALDVDEKAPHVANFHTQTLESFFAVLGAAGVGRVDDLKPHHIHRRIDPAKVRSFAEIYQFIKPGALLAGDIPSYYQKPWEVASAERW